MNYNIVNPHRFSTKRLLVDINGKNRTPKTHICLFVISEIVTSQNLNERGKDYVPDEKGIHIMLQWYCF